MRSEHARRDDLENPQSLAKRIAVGEGVEPRLQHNQLADAAGFDTHCERALSNVRACDHEEPHAALRLLDFRILPEEFRIKAEDRDRQGILENAALLQHLDRIKIAQDFVEHIATVSGSAAIVRATIGLARELGINVIAEGVETTKQLELLKVWGCREAQGFYFARPLEPDDLTPLLRHGGILQGQSLPTRTAA